MSNSYRELLTLTNDELIEAHDQLAVNTGVGVDYYLAELRRREQARSNYLIVRLTLVNAVLAGVAVVIAVIALVLS